MRQVGKVKRDLRDELETTVLATADARWRLYEAMAARDYKLKETPVAKPTAATVAVLPEADEIDLKIDPQDLRIDVFRASGPGGQSVNTTDSAVRITHIPTGLVVSQQDQKSQLQNKLKGMEVLRARLLDLRVSQQEAERSKMRKSQVSTGDRSAKIRTYNWPQSRVTDHRINFTTHNLPGVMNGEIGAAPRKRVRRAACSVANAASRSAPGPAVKRSRVRRRYQFESSSIPSSRRRTARCGS